MSEQLSRSKVALMRAIDETAKIDMSVENVLVGNSRYFATEYIEYEVKDNKTKTANYTKFNETAKIVKRNGIDVVRLEPFYINDKTPFDQLELYQAEFGNSIYDKSKKGEEYIDAEAINYYLHGGALMRQKKLIASILQNLKLTKAKDKVDADFNIDLSKYALTLTNRKWDNNDAEVIKNLQQLKKLSKGSIYIMSLATYTNMIANGDLRTADDTSNGLAKNYELNSNADATKEFYKIGRVLDPQAMGDVYIWESTDDGETYLEDGYVASTSPKVLQGLFGGIVARPNPKSKAKVLRGEYIVQYLQSTDPDIDAIQYKSAPMFAPTGSKKIATMKVY